MTGAGDRLSAAQSSCRRERGRYLEGGDRQTRTPGWRNASQLARDAVAVSSQGLLCELVELAACGVLLDALIEAGGIEAVEPRAEPRQLAGGEAFDSFFDVFDIAHEWIIAFFGEA